MVTNYQKLGEYQKMDIFNKFFYAREDKQL